MPRSSTPRRVLWSAVALGVTGALVLAAPVGAGAAPRDAPSAPAPAPAAAPGRYVVTLADQPLASYTGGVRGIPGTRPTEGRKVEVTSNDARRYAAYLADQQDEVAARVGARPDQRYSVALNGFTTTLTTAQARQLQGTPGVISVAKDTLRVATDDRDSTDFLRLSGKKGVWAGVGGTSKAGRGVVVGVIDTGIWPESASFDGSKLGTAKPTKRDPYRPYRKSGKIVMKKSDGSTFKGVCQTGEKFTTSDCSTKIVGARYFVKGFEEGGPIAEGEYRSPRDGEGHGSHTASTAAGGHGVTARADGRSFGKISGVAPAATIASYKALWTAGPDGDDGGATSDIVAAVDAAVGDGVDVINYSVGSTVESPATDPIAIAYLNAALAGIFVSASAGNSGPDASTLDNTSPWVTTVAASSIKNYDATVRLGNGASYLGASTTVTSTVGPARVTTAAGAKLAGATSDDAAICTPGTLDPAKAGGKIVVCDRGVVSRVDKSAEVERAGGIGMVLLNLTTNSLDGDLHAVPTIIVNPPASAAIKTYAATGNAVVTLQSGNKTDDKIAYPEIAGFSSRGPSLASGGDLLKPDIAAPGVNILAAVAPPFNSGRKFDFYSGTSMAAPHIAGLAALFLGKGVHPTWSPSVVKSALMTTAVDTKRSGGGRPDPHAQGAGEVTPQKMFNPGLVYKAGDRAWFAYLEGLGIDTQTGVAAVDPSDYNAPSIAIGSLLGKQTVTRKVTAVRKGTYRATASVPGITTSVSPSTLKFTKAGQTKTYKVTFTRTTAPSGSAATGFLTWKSTKAGVRSPLAVTPQEVEAPGVVAGQGATGQVQFQVVPGLSGPYPITASGLAVGAVSTGSVAADQAQQATATVGAGARAAQFVLRSPNQGADIDLFVYRLDGGQRVSVGDSTSLTANETVTVTDPEAGSYVAVVAGYENAPTTSTTAWTLSSASVGAGAGAGSFAASPASSTATGGTAIPVTASWSGVDTSKTYLGFVGYPGGSGTAVTVN